MSIPSRGDYVILNRVTSASGQRLAITFNGVKEKVTVKPYTGKEDKNAVWSFVPFFDGKTMSIKPKHAGSSLEAAWGDSDDVIVLTPGNYVWTVRSNEDGYTIKDGKDRVFWGLQDARDGAHVHIGADEKYAARWVLERVDNVQEENLE